MKFRVIVIDAPWMFEDALSAMKDGVDRSAASKYPTLDLDAIKALPVREISEDDAVLGLWCPSSMLQDGLDVMKAWGFAQKQVWTWVKITKNGGIAFGMGRLARNATENMLVGVRGSPYKYLQFKGQRNVFFAAAGRHSQKPECIQDALDQMFPEDNRLEMFARRARPGWLCVGNESPTTPGEDIRETLRRLTWVEADHG